MSNAIVGFPRWTGEATFTAGSAAAGYPAANLGTLPLAYPWRSGGSTPLAAASTAIAATFATARKIGLVVVGPHNLSIGSSMRVRSFFDDAGTDMVTETTVETWPAVFTEDQVDWDGGRWWDRTYTQDEVSGYPWYRPILLPVEAYVRRVTVEIFDPLNPNGFVQAGLVELASVLRFPVNPEYGLQYGYRGRTETQEADGGTLYRRRRAKPRKVTGSVPYMPRDGAQGSFMEMQRQLDIDTPFFWWLDPDDERGMVRNAWMAHFAELSLQAYATYDRDAVPVNIEEEL